MRFRLRVILKKSSEDIFQEQTRLLYNNSLTPIIISILAATVLCWSSWSMIDHLVLSFWGTTFFAISFCRLLLLYLYNNRKAEDKNDHWNRRFTVGTYAIATVWGTASLLLFPEHNPSQQIVFFVIMVGMCAGGISSLCPSPIVFTGFISLILLPLIIRLMFLGTEGTMLNSVLIFIFWGVTLISGLKISGNMRENIHLRLQGILREQVLSANEERYRLLFRHAPLGIFQYDDKGTIIDCNQEFVRILGSSKDLLVGFNMLAMLPKGEMLDAIKQSFISGEGYFEGDYATITSNLTIPVRVFFKTLTSTTHGSSGGVAIIEDCSAKKQSEQLIQYHASYDSLTGLPNRRLLIEQLGSEISRSKRHKHYGALLFLDLDNFKTINDSLGHSVGDKLLQIAAARISECIRKEDTAARMGGDEFIIVLTELGSELKLAEEKAKGIAEKILLNLSTPCQIEERDLHITTSIGVSMFPKTEKGVDDILKQADTAMYRAKAAGRNGVCFFLPSMQETADNKLILTTEIRQALHKNELIIFLQPQVDSSTNLIGAEALVRWKHPEKGIIPPGAFLAIAEETGLIQNIGQWVLRETCQKIKMWTDAGLLKDSQVISINISGKEIAAPDFVSLISRVLKETGASPHHFGIELTEGSLISTDNDIVEKIMALRRIGIKFSVDDFGTGYSSLSYLKSLPLHTLKIDRSFVTDIKDASHNAVLVDTIIMMAHNLGLDVIAEGVETEQELQYLESKGCTVYQGYYFSKPVTIETFTEMLRSGSSVVDHHGIS